MTLEIDHNEIHSTPSIDRNICTPANESSKSSDNTNQNNLQTEDENISEVPPLLNNTVCTSMISNEKNVSRKEDKQINMSNSFVTSLSNFNDELNNFNLKNNLNFLQKSLRKKPNCQNPNGNTNYSFTIYSKPKSQ